MHIIVILFKSVIPKWGCLKVENVSKFSSRGSCGLITTGGLVVKEVGLGPKGFRF